MTFEGHVVVCLLATLNLYSCSYSLTPAITLSFIYSACSHESQEKMFPFLFCSLSTLLFWHLLLFSAEVHKVGAVTRRYRRREPAFKYEPVLRGRRAERHIEGMDWGK